MDKPVTRRGFTQAGAAALGLAVVGTARAQGANERVGVGLIGVANRGGQLLTAFLKQPDVQIVALCDVFKPTLQHANARLDGKASLYNDFRQLLDRKDVDAVVIATPDHWHAIQTIAACKAGKDVYVEKPLSMTIVEGQRMVEVARQTQRVVQVGLQRRSGRLYADMADMIRAGKLGKITLGRGYHLSNMYPTGIGREKPQPPPPDLDWDLWLGPRPLRPYQPNIAPYKFRWWHLYSSQIANQGVHFLDVMRWLVGDVGPVAVCAMGGRYAVDDDRTIPDTMEAVFEFPSGWLAVFGVYESSGNPAMPKPAFVEMRGTLGTLYASDRSFEVVPERGGQFQDHAPRMQPISAQGSDGDLTEQHVRNFLDCVKSRQKPNADVEIGHRSTSLSLLANISLATGLRLQWDVDQQRITNSEEANALLHYEYRAPWKLD